MTKRHGKVVRSPIYVLEILPFNLGPLKTIMSEIFCGLSR
jgi:hypothetical protein